MKVVGLTGKACAGKNRIAKVFEEKGFEVLDADIIGHQALEDKKEEIRKAFGETVFKDGKVDRRALGNIVFSSEEKLRILENISHPYIKEICKKAIEKSSKNVLINAAILQRGQLVELCDNVIFVNASFSIRFKRSKKRDKRNLLWFIKRDLSQKDINVRNLKKAINDVFVLNNEASDSEIHRQIDNYCDIFIDTK